MRVRSLVVMLGFCVACQRPVDVRGVYVSHNQTGIFFPCDEPTMLVRVSDSVLASKYRLHATKPHEPLFVRLRGVPSDSGSIYYSSHHFLVEQILEIRPRRGGECPTVATAIPLAPITPRGLPNKGCRARSF